MKTFKEYLIESENDPRADITIPYKTPEDIRQIMATRGGESSESGPASSEKTREKKPRKKQREREERREAGIISGSANDTGKMSMRDIATQLGIHHSGVAQIEDSAFAKLLAGIRRMQNDPSMLQAWTDANRSRNIGNRGKKNKD